MEGVSTLRHSQGPRRGTPLMESTVSSHGLGAPSGGEGKQPGRNVAVWGLIRGQTVPGGGELDGAVQRYLESDASYLSLLHKQLVSY